MNHGQQVHNLDCRLAIQESCLWNPIAPKVRQPSTYHVLVNSESDEKTSCPGVAHLRLPDLVLNDYKLIDTHIRSCLLHSTTGDAPSNYTPDNVPYTPIPLGQPR